MANSEAFDDTFALLDSNGKKRITFDQIYQFAQTFPNPPLKSVLSTLYKKYDEDNSGDIDQQEFYGLCKELEKESKMTSDEMSEYYTRVQYQKLWMLVVGAEGKDVRQVKDTDEIKREELRAFLEITLSNIKFNGDLALTFKKVLGADQMCDFKNFRKIVGQIVKGKNIVAITEVFTSAKKQRKENRDKALNKFIKGAETVRVRIKEQHEEEDINAIAKNAKSLPEPSNTDVYTEAFVLMDARGGGVISLDAIYEFCDSFPSPPQPSHVRKLYSAFDEDGSGDIDPEEFVGFCRGLEILCKLPTKDMNHYFRQATFKRLFELVTQGSGSEFISKDGLRVFLEAISPILSGRYTMEDIYGMIRKYDTEELDFTQFSDLVTVLLKGKSISQVVQVFEDSMRKRKAQKHKAQKLFESADKKAGLNLPGAIQGEIADGAAMRICFQCMEKKERMRELQHENELLKSEILQLKQQIGAASATEPSKVVDVRAVLEEDTLHGNPFTDIHQLHSINSAPYYSKFPQLVKPALHAAKTTRILEICNWFEQLKVGGAIDTAVASRKVNESGPQVISHLDQLKIVMDPVFDDIAQVIALQEDLQQTLLQHNMNKHPEALEEKLDLIQSYRMHLQTVSADVEWMLDSVVEEIVSMSSAALSAAPFSNKHFEMMELIVQSEHSVQELLDLVTVALQFSSKQLSDGEIQAKRLVAKAVDTTDQTLLAGILETLDECKKKLNKPLFAQKISSLTETLRSLMKVASIAAATKRDKCCMTMPVDPVFQPNQKRTESTPAATQHTDPSQLEIANRSSSPRLRQKNLRPKDTVAHVDGILRQYQNFGLSMPDNFKRVDPGSNTFQFGTRKIELSAVDRSIVVKVGGGYMLLEEFCEKYYAMEMRRINVLATKQQLSAGRSYSPSNPGTPVSATPSSRLNRERDHPAHETRVLFRGSGGLVLK